MNPMHHGRTLLQRSEPPEQIAAVLQVDSTTVALLSLVRNTNHVSNLLGETGPALRVCVAPCFCRRASDNARCALLVPDTSF